MEVVAGILDVVLFKEERDAIILAQESQGQTPLHLALPKADDCHPFKPEIVTLLVRTNVQAGQTKSYQGSLA